MSALRAARRPSTSLLALLAVWVVLVAWRPFAFGFYHDDWSSVALPLDRAGALLQALAADPARPVYIVVLRVLRIAFGANAWAWQATMALLHLACAVAIARASTALFASQQAERVAPAWPGIVAGAAWLAFPWSLGYSAWPVMLPPLLGMLLAAWAFVLLAEGRGRWALAASGALLVASWLVYESTWFFWGPLFLLALAQGGLRRASLWRFVGCMALLQLAFVGLNRVLAAGSPMAKKVSTQLLATLQTDQHLVLAQLLPQLQPVMKPLVAALAALAACAVVGALRSRAVPRLLLQLVALLGGMAVAVVLYAAAGYAIEWEGLFSRVTLAISFWLALLVGALAFAAEAAVGNRLVWAVRAAGAVACAALAVALVQQSQAWRRSWDEQQAIIAAMPARLLELADSRTLVLMDLPRGPAPVYNFSAFWDISGALGARLPLEQTITSSTHAYATVLRPGEWTTSWDGQTVRQAWCSSQTSPLWQLPATRVVLWHYPDNQVVQLEPGFSKGCPAPAQ